MLKALLARIRQKHRTIRFPGARAGAAGPLPRPARDRRARAAPADCRGCVEACPTGAIAATSDRPAHRPRAAASSAPTASQACPHGALRFTQDYRLAARERGRPGHAPSARILPRARARRQGAPALRPLAEAAPGQRRRLQRLRGGRERAGHGGLRPGPVRHPVRRLAAPRRRPAHHRPGHGEHAAGAAEDLRGRCRRRSSSSPSAPAPSPAGRTSATPKSTTARPNCCPWTSISPAARRTR